MKKVLHMKKVLLVALVLLLSLGTVGYVGMGKYNQVVSDLAAAQAKNASLEKDVAPVQTQITADKTTIGGLENDIAAAQAKMTELQTNLAAVSSLKGEGVVQADSYVQFLNWWLSGSGGSLEARVAAVNDPKFRAFIGDTKFQEMCGEYMRTFDGSTNHKELTAEEWKALMAKYVATALYLTTKVNGSLQ